MQLVGRVWGAAASPRSRKASTSPPPMNAPSPSRGQSRRVIDSQFLKIPIGFACASGEWGLRLCGGEGESVFEDELGGVEEGPEEVFEGEPAIGLRTFEEVFSDRPFLLSGVAAVGEQVYLIEQF